MIATLLFAVSIFSSAYVTVFYKNYTQMNTGKKDLSVMLFASVAPLTLIYAVLAYINGFDFSLPVIITGIVSGICNLTAIIYLLKSMTSGSFTISIIIINLNFCVPILLSRAFLGEQVSLFQLIGIVLLIGVIIITNLQGDGTKNAQEGKKQSKKYLIYAVLACVANGLINFMIKLQQYYTPEQGQDTFYLVMYASCTLICGIAYIIFDLIEKKRNLNLKGATVDEKGKLKKIALTIFGIGFGVGACNAVSLYPQSLLPKYVSAPIQFTVTAAGAVLLSLIIGFIKYKEKPTVKNVVSSICCMLTIFLQLLA